MSLQISPFRPMKHSEKIVLLPVKPSLGFRKEPQEEQQCFPARGMRGLSSPLASQPSGACPSPLPGILVQVSLATLFTLLGVLCYLILIATKERN